MPAKKSIKLLSAAGALVLSMVCFASQATPPTPLSESNCTLTENARLTINFSGQEKEASAVKGKFDTQIDEVKKMAKTAALSKFEEQSMNYNINAQSTGGDMDSTYRFNGSAVFVLEPADKAANFVDLLSKKGYKANLNVNSYRNCNPETNLLKGAIGNVITPLVTPAPLPPYQR
jgi:hypothetical protein